MAQLKLWASGPGNGPGIPSLFAVIVIRLLPLEHTFDSRIWRKAQLLVAEAILHSGKRAVASALSIPRAVDWATSPSSAGA